MAENWDAMQFAARDNLLRVVKNEANSVFALTEKNWESPTTSGHWEARDIIGHLVDVTEGYLDRFKTTREGGTPEAIGPLTEMARLADERALTYRSTEQPELLKRLREAFDQVIDLFEGLSEEDWTNLMVTHGYMGSLPAFIYPVFQLMDYGVHGWDIREGLGMAHSMSADVADFLAPFMFILWQATCDVERCEGQELNVGFRVSGRNGGSFRVKVSPEGYTYEPGDVDDLPTVFDFDPASLVLTAFGRARAGTAYGDMEIANKYRSLFFSI
ncbi:MAG: maleylpyruvate isomerase family mycothiol-dependent enzyme [Gaiellales bacterium]